MSARPLPEPVRAGLDLTLARRQAEWRSTGVAATVVRRGEPLWSGAVGTSDADDPAALPTTDTQFRIPAAKLSSPTCNLKYNVSTGKVSAHCVGSYSRRVVC